MIKIQNNLNKIELNDVWCRNGEVYYFARTSIGAIKEFIKLHKEQAIDEEWGEGWQKKLVARQANKDQIELAVDSICENYASRYLRADQLRRSIERYCFVVDFN